MTSKPNKIGDADGATPESNEDLSEITVVRPRSVLDEAFDAHTVVRPEAKRTLNPTVSNTGEFPPPPPMPNHKPSWTPDPTSRPSGPKNEVKNDSDLTRVSPIPMPPVAPPPGLPTGPSASEIEAQALAVAQERARLKAQQSAEQAMQKAALAQAEATRETARRASEEALRENVRRHQQAAREEALEEVQRRDAITQSASPTFGEETSSAFEPARRQLPWKLLAAGVVVICLGFYLLGGKSRVGQNETQVLTKDSSKSVDSSSSISAQKDEDVATPGEAVSSADVRSIQSLLSAFDDAFSRTQVRARPESRD